MSRHCSIAGTCSLAPAGDRGRQDEVGPVEAGGRRRRGMRAAILLIVEFTAIAAVAAKAAIIMDGSVASAAFREERASTAKPQRWHDDDASATSRRRHYDSPVFDQIIVETVEQPARHRPSLAFILAVFVTGLFIGAIALLLCVLWLLKALSGRYWPVAQRDDTLCVIEDHGRPLADIKFKQQQANVPLETPIVSKECDVAQSARDGTSVRDVKYTTRNAQHSARQTPLQRARDGPAYKAPTGEYREPQYSRDRQQHARGSSNWSKTPLKSSTNVQPRQELYIDDESVDDRNSAKALSNLRLNLRINEESSRTNDSGGGGFRQHTPESYSSSSYSSGENTAISQASKSRSIRFCISPEKKGAKDFGNKTSLMDTRTHSLKESRALPIADYRASQVTKAHANFIGEENTTEVYQSTRNNEASRPRSKNSEYTPRPASTTPLFGRTTPQHDDGARQHVVNADQLKLDQVKVLVDEILNKKANRKVKHSS
ncbi:hypothetical protein HPB52_011357 [Rhipicephalus sanguineus]|uniref:Uncharacterized protein n=1 Tax=Rhipicephalus sanguineus TaxID=34632 RepID=A0A9D4SYH8_RHISA|nr:hypothetical protein HPB52_011357 [Rhipicephalus sanguineus]